MPSPSRKEILLAYRHLYKHLLRAVQYSKPSRYVVQDRIRNAFRNSTIEEYDAARIEKTLEFLDGAAKSRGFEHRILKNLTHVWWEQKTKVPYIRIRDKDMPFRNAAYEDFDRTIRRLNESMGLCIK